MYPLKILDKLQRCAALWISRAFKTAPLAGIKAIASLIPIYLHLQKLSGRFQLRAHTLPVNHILWSLMKNNIDSSYTSHPLLLSSLPGCQHSLIKGYLVDMENRFNKVFSSFDSLNPEFKLGDRIIDCFSNRFFSFI